MGAVIETSGGTAAPTSSVKYLVTHDGVTRESSSEPTGSYAEEATKIVKVEDGVETVIKDTTAEPAE